MSPGRAEDVRAAVVAMSVAWGRVTVSVPARRVAVCRVAVASVRRLGETAQRHDAKANSAERQTERVGVHERM
jgi:hypothetical protein